MSLMNKELSRKLTEKYPQLLRYVDGSCGRYKNSESYDFQCGDGWHDLVDNMCREIVSLGDPNVVLVQVKEKFGYLRVYCEQVENRDVYVVISNHEERSVTTCMSCGNNEGKLGGKGWVNVLCDPCRAKKKF